MDKKIVEEGGGGFNGGRNGRGEVHVTNEEEETDKEAGRWRRNGTHDSFDVLR